MAGLNLKNNPELAKARHREQNRAYYRRNREKCKLAHKLWCDANPGYKTQWARDKKMLSNGGEK